MARNKGAISTGTLPVTVNSTYEDPTGLLPGNPEATKATVFINTHHSSSLNTSFPDDDGNVYKVTFGVLKSPVLTGKYLPIGDLLLPSSGSGSPTRVLDSIYTF